MFTPTTLFKGIACPQGTECGVLNCIFKHEPDDRPTETVKPALDSTVQTGIHSAQDHDEQPIEPPPKRRKITYDKLEDKPLSRAEQIKAQLQAERKTVVKANAQPRTVPLKPIASLTRTVTPPKATKQDETRIHTKDGNDIAETTPTSPWLSLKARGKGKPESLNPRVLHPAPDSHAKRVFYLQHIHSNMARLNREAKTATQSLPRLSLEVIKALVLNDQEITILALDDEEAVGKKSVKVYPNNIRNCIAMYGKMGLAAWLLKLQTMQGEINDNSDNSAAKNRKPAKIVKTGLPAGYDHLILPHLFIQNQAALQDFGYISTPPSNEQALEEAKLAKSMSNFEQCDRCGARFQVFPDRDTETGHLTSNGPCKYHWARKIFPTRQKTDSYTGSNEAIYPCCGQSVGTEGCTTSDDHVYKISSASRLTAVMQFVTTPDNDVPRLDPDGKPVSAVVFDCEMGYTTNGMELIRLTAVSWPDNKALVDVLVRPLGTVIDLNTRFSGVKPEHIANAAPYVKGGSSISRPDRMVIVDSPMVARQLLCDFLTPSTPLLGHAIDNDLNTTRLCHPTIIDTVLLFSHPRGLPYRYGLKMLSKKYLDRDIQMGGASGHDSKEDAIATGDLVKAKAGDVWRDLMERGWKYDNGQLVRPSGDDREIGWSTSSKSKIKPNPATPANDLAKIIQEARSATAPPDTTLTSAFLES